MRLIVIVVFAILAFLFGIFYLSIAEKQREAQQACIKQVELQKEFQLEVNRAKQETGDPCSPEFYKVVEPPTVLATAPGVVVMGEQIFAHTHRAQYSLVPVPGNRMIEVWLDTRCCEGGLAIKAKIGEKYLPNHPRCSGGK